MIGKDDLAPLPPDVQAAVRADAALGNGIATLGGSTNPPDLVRQRVLGRLRMSIAAQGGAGAAAGNVQAGGTGAGTGATGAVAKGSLARLAGGWVGKSVLLAALVGGGAAMHAAWPTRPSRPAAAGEGAVATAPAAPSPDGTDGAARSRAAAVLRGGAVAGGGVPATPAVGAGSAGTEGDPSGAAGASGPTEHATPERARSARASRASRLAAERALLDRARRELMRGDGDGALGPLGQHASTFPRGQLVEEREGMRVKALVLAGRQAEARARAQRFRQRFPQSLFLPVVEAALRSAGS